jgi:hypothetical protein
MGHAGAPGCQCRRQSGGKPIQVLKGENMTFCRRSLPGFGMLPATAKVPAAEDHDYNNYRQFYRSVVVRAGG